MGIYLHNKKVGLSKLKTSRPFGLNKCSFLQILHPFYDGSNAHTTTNAERNEPSCFIGSFQFIN